MVTATKNSTNQTVFVFDSFYNINLVVNASEYDVVYSYFFGVCDNPNIAANFTAVLFRIAQDGRYNVIDMLETLKGVNNNLQMNATMCYYLNTFKSKASLYGISQIPNPNQAVQRNVVL
jgi:hypothetical protein